MSNSEQNSVPQSHNSKANQSENFTSMGVLKVPSFVKSVKKIGKSLFQ